MEQRRTHRIRRRQMRCQPRRKERERDRKRSSLKRRRRTAPAQMRDQHRQLIRMERMWNRRRQQRGTAVTKRILPMKLARHPGRRRWRLRRRNHQIMPAAVPRKRRAACRKQKHLYPSRQRKRQQRILPGPVSRGVPENSRSQSLEPRPKE